MNRKRTLLLLAVTGITLALALLVAPAAPAFGPGGGSMMWVATSNWLACDQTSQAKECANWQPPDGSMVYLSCCVPTSALGTSDFEACKDGGRTRSGRPEL
jgi:hypothetical protein